MIRSGPALVLLVLTIVYGFHDFDFIYVMTYGGPGTATNTLPFLGYLQASHMTSAWALRPRSSQFAGDVLTVLYSRSILRRSDEPEAGP